MRPKRVIPSHPSDVWDVSSSSSEPDEELEMLKDRIRSEEARYQSAKKKGQ